MTIQTTYGYIKSAVAGQLVDMYTNEIVSKLIEDVAGCAFGKAVVRGTADNQVKLGVGSFGIAVRELTREADKRGTGAATTYLYGNSAAILRKGHINVELGTAAGGVSAGDVVAALPDGTIVKTGTATAVDIAGATFEEAGATGDIVEIRLA